MTLGERICALRTEQGLSQEDLAQLLQVSRQSVSKWETDASLPELDKLLGLSKVFNLTLDELVKGPQPTPEPPQSTPEPPPAAPKEPSPRPPINPAQRIAGAVLTGLGAVFYALLLLLGGDFLLSLTWAGVLLFPGLLCLFVRRRAGLWSAWAVWLCIELYLRLGTGLNWNVILATLHWTPQMNYTRLIIGWVMALVPTALIARTVWSFRQTPYPPKPLIRFTQVEVHPAFTLTMEWLVLVLYRTLLTWQAQLLLTTFHKNPNLTYNTPYGSSYFWLTILNDWLTAALLCTVLTHTLGYLRWHKSRSNSAQTP